MKKILIIGGCGYIGSALYISLNKYHQVDTVDIEWFRNFVNPKNKNMDFNNIKQTQLDKYDVVILVAANSSVKLCEDLFDTFDNNVVKFINLVKKLKKQKFIYASSSCVYGTSGDEAVKEEELSAPTDGLTLTKTTIDHFMPLTDVEYYGLRFGSVAGWSPNTRLDLMINAMTFSAQKNKQVNVTNGHAYRPILSINDLCRAIITIIDSNVDNRGIYNIASFNNNIMHIGKKVAELMNVPLHDNGKNITYDFIISSEKFQRTFDFQFKDSIESIVANLISNPYNVGWSTRQKKYEL